MKQKLFWSVPVLILCCLLVGGALANDYDISSYSGVLTIPAGTHTIKNDSSIINTDLQIVCSAPNTTLTLENVNINVYSTGSYLSTNGKCPLTFTGGNNQLILSGTSTLTAGLKEPGIKVETGTTLTISGSGTLTVSGGPVCASGIGSSYNNDCGTIVINSGTINANGGRGGSGGVQLAGSGIGGGCNYHASSSGGSVTINGGTITATGDPGIGGGSYCNGFYVEINGGVITALPPYYNPATLTSDSYGTGIGGGTSSSGTGTVLITGGQITARGGFNSPGIGAGYTQVMVPTITITGGVVSAYGGRGSAGIGSGYASSASSAGNFIISGGLVYACRGSSSSLDEDRVDIGKGARSNSGNLTVSGDAVVILASNTYNLANNGLPDGHVNKTTTDSPFPMTFISNAVFGVTVDSSWTGALGGFFRLPILTYNRNGGTGTKPASPTPTHMQTTATVADGSGLTKAGYTFTGWNTQRDGLGTAYAPGDAITITEDTKLFAQWTLTPTATATPTPTAVPTAVPTMPQTGDGFRLILYIALTLLAICGLFCVTVLWLCHKRDTKK